MRKAHIVASVSVVLLILGVLSYNSGKTRLGRATDPPVPLTKLSASHVSSTRYSRPIRFETVAVNQPDEDCILLFTPDEFQKYGADQKWAISSMLGFTPGFFDRLPATGRAVVTGEYVFVKDRESGPCGTVTGQLFVISHLEYF